MIFNKEETRNLLNMLRSADKENATVAFEALKGVDAKKYLGELITLYKFGRHTLEEWKTNCPKPAALIIKTVEPYVNSDEWGALSTGACLSAITGNKPSNQSIELFMELFTESMMGFLGQMGYPADKFDIIVKLKENGQSTESK